MNSVTWRNLARGFGIMTIAVLLISFFVGLEWPGKFEADADVTSPTAPVTPGATDEPATDDTGSCDPAFRQYDVGHDNARVDEDFADKYARATAQANNLSEAQVNLLLEESAKSAQTLAIWAHAFGLYEDPNDWESLVDGDCLSREGERLHAKFDGALTASGSKVEEGQAPADGYNSGVNEDGTYGIDDTQNVGGDRRAIKVTLKDGTVVWIMVRCGNPVYPGNAKPNLPTVPTDNPPPTNPPPGNPPPPNEAKDPSQDPYPQGNAPVGGGTNSDSGPGTYVPPQEMEQPPAQTYVPPPPPPPAPPPSSGGGSAPAPTPDPAPAPTPEPEAPTPDEPEIGCTPIPGVMDCYG